MALLLANRDLAAPPPVIERLKKGLPEGVVMQEPTYLDPHDDAFTDRSKVEGLRWTYEQMRIPMDPEFRQMRELGDMFIGRQWTREEQEWRTNLGRYVYTLNIMLPQQVAVEGVFLNNRTKLKVIPRGAEDTDQAVLRTEVLNHSLDEAQYYHHLRRVFSDALIFRRGWRAHSWEYTGRYPDGQYVYRRVNPFDVLFDTDNAEIDVNKGRRLIVNRFLSGDRIMQLYVGHENKELRQYIDSRMNILEGPMARDRRKRSQSMRYQDISGEFFSRDKKSGMGEAADQNEVGAGVSTDYFDFGRGLYRVIELHERRYVDRTFIYDPASSEEIPIAPGKERDVPLILQALGLSQANVRIRTIPEYWVAVAAPGLSDEVMLMERPYTVQGAQDDLGFAVKCMGAYDFHPDKGKTVGLGDLLRDFQDAINRSRSNKDDVIGRFINPGVYGPAEAFEEYLDDWKNRKMAAIRRYKFVPGQPSPQFEYPAPGIAQLLDSDIDHMSEFATRTTGISPSIMGFRQVSNESGVQADLYRKQSEVMIAPLLENLRQQQREDGRFANAMISELMTDERVIRILSPENGSYRFLEVNKWDYMSGQKINSISEEWWKFDTEIDDQAFTSMQREEFYSQWSQFVDKLPQPELRTALMAEILPLTQFGRKDQVVAVLNRWLSVYAPQLLDQGVLLKMMGQQGMPAAGGVPGAEMQGGPGVMPPDAAMQGMDAPNLAGATDTAGRQGPQIDPGMLAQLLQGVR